MVKSVNHPSVHAVVVMCVVVAIIIGVSCSTVALASSNFNTVLDNYVAQFDDTYTWNIAKEETTADGFTILQVEVTSQTWREAIWKHRLFIIIPPKVNSTKATLMYVSASGSGRDEIEAVKELAGTLQVPMAVLMDIPNQPLFNGLREDALIAHTFDRFFESGDSDWPALLPMVKGTVRAMDAYGEVVKEKYGWDTHQFVVAGASKRGWTTWLTGAIDDRVIGIAPAVYNNLNLQEQMSLQARTFPGGASPKIHDYTDMNLHEMIHTEKGHGLSDIVDPYAYIDRLTMPKMLLHGTNDPYWPVDAANVYVDELPGTTYIVNFPNGGHDLGDIPRLLTSLGIFFMHVTELPILPEIQWSLHEFGDGVDEGVEGAPRGRGPVKLHVKRPPFAQDASMWVALSRTRDFTNVTWMQAPVQEDDHGWFGAPLSVGGMYVAYYIEVKVGFSAEDTFRIDTPVFVIEP